MYSRRTVSIIIVLAALPALLFSSSLDLEAECMVNTVTLSWSGVDGASWYDIYNGDQFIVRLPSDARSYTMDHLAQDTDYRFVMGARDRSNADLNAEAVRVHTGDYGGTYVWTNPTDDDNDGMMKEVVYSARLMSDPTYGQYLQISISEDGQEHVVFPLVAFDSSWDWIDYDSDEPTAVAYRLNCEKFNSLGISPSRFRVESVNMTNDRIEVSIRSSAFGIGVSTVSIYEFGCDDEGRYVKFTTTGSGLAEAALFRNPTDPENPYTYLLRNIED